jgi:hypothetical protein
MEEICDQKLTISPLQLAAMLIGRITSEDALAISLRSIDSWERHATMAIFVLVQAR